MKRQAFLTGDFVVWKGNTYRCATYRDEYELFNMTDTGRLTPLRRIPKDEAEDKYTQFAYCDIRNVRYTAVSVSGDELLYKSFISDEYFVSERIDQCNEIWLVRRRGEYETTTEVEDIWLRPYCIERPSSQKFYAEPMAEGGLMEIHDNRLLSFDETAKILDKAFGQRIKIDKGTPTFDGEYYTTFELDGKNFDFSIDMWKLVGISPYNKADSYLIHEIVKALNDSVNNMQEAISPAKKD